MILAEKIVKLRKQLGWSQEELAEKINVSRQSVSKWEATNSIPDLNKIIKLAEIFEVSTDYLLKDNLELSDSEKSKFKANNPQVSLEQALSYVENKLKTAHLVAKGVFLCVTSAIPIIALSALTKSHWLDLSGSSATSIGIILLLIMLVIGISLFIKTNQFKADLAIIDDEDFELAYGVDSVFREKSEEFRARYNLNLFIGIALFLFSFVPLMLTNSFSLDHIYMLIAIIMLFLMVASGIYILITSSAHYDAYNKILKEEQFSEKKRIQTKRAERLGAFYWPLLAAIYLGWSFLSNDWQITWLVWPVGGLLFVVLLGVMAFLDKKKS